MSNLTLSMALARNSKPAARDEDTPMVDSPMEMEPTTPRTPTGGPNRPPLTKEETDGEEAIPAFAHLIPAIFVPLKQDLLAPIEPAKDLAERVRRAQKSLDANETAVRQNLAFMFEREARRTVAVAKKTFDFSEPHRPEPINWAEADQLMASMSAQPIPGKTYHIPPETLATWNQRIGFAVPGTLPPHEYTTRQVLATANNGSKDIEDYSMRHIKPMREKLKASLEKADGM